MDDAYQAVLAANQRFYQAFNEGDMPGMEAVWSRDLPVQCIHPGWDPVLGREAVLESWRDIFDHATGATLAPREERVLLQGEAAMVLTFEQIGDQPLIATNLFAREAGEWRMTHHHAGPCRSVPPSPGGAPSRLQ